MNGITTLQLFEISMLRSEEFRSTEFVITDSPSMFLNPDRETCQYGSLKWAWASVIRKEIR